MTSEPGLIRHLSSLTGGVIGGYVLAWPLHARFPITLIAASWPFVIAVLTGIAKTTTA